MLTSTVANREVLSGIFMLLLVIHNPMWATTAAQDNNKNGLLLKAIQDAPPIDSRYLKAKVIVKGFELNADVPVTGEQMSKGLSVKDQLKENEAMLFVFEQSARHSFWMKDMKFPIDIIWLDSDEKVVYIKENMQPCISTIICLLYTPNPILFGSQLERLRPNPGSLLIAKPKKSFLLAPSVQSKAKRTIADER